MPSRSDWLTYTHASGITLRYPRDWHGETINFPDGTSQFRLMLDGKHMVGVGFGGGPPDISAFYENDPRMRYVGNENGAGIRWLAEIRRRTVVGIKFLWAPGITAPPYAENSFLEGGELHARLINTTDSLQQFRTKHSVGIVWPVSDAESIRYAGQYGTERMVKDRFQDFEFFVDNVRFPDEQGP